MSSSIVVLMLAAVLGLTSTRQASPSTTAGAVVAAAATPPVVCEGPGVHPWVTEQRDLTLSYDGLFGYAVQRHGAPVACDGAVTTEFDGVPYGRLVMTFADGIEYEVETMPIETSVRTLRTAAGFADAAAVEEALRTAAADTGLEIDWSSPEETVDGGLTTRRFQDPEPGLNASVAFVYRDGVLIEARISMAL